LRGIERKINQCIPKAKMMKTNKNITIVVLSLFLMSSAVGCTLIDVKAKSDDASPLGTQVAVETMDTAVDAEIVQGDTQQEPATSLPINDTEDDSGDQQEVITLEVFKHQLMSAIETHNFMILPSMVNETFSFALWRSEGWFATSVEAIELLRSTYLTPEVEIRFQESPDLKDEIPEGDILNVWNPGDNPVSALFSTGWEVSGKGEAFLIVSERTDGTFTWIGMVYAPAGFTTPVTQ